MFIYASSDRTFKINWCFSKRNHLLEIQKQNPHKFNSINNLDICINEISEKFIPKRLIVQQKKRKCEKKENFLEKFFSFRLIFNQCSYHHLEYMINKFFFVFCFCISIHIMHRPKIFLKFTHMCLAIIIKF